MKALEKNGLGGGMVASLLVVAVLGSFLSHLRHDVCPNCHFKQGVLGDENEKEKVCFYDYGFRW